MFYLFFKKKKKKKYIYKSKYYYIRPLPPSIFTKINRPFIIPKPPDPSIKRLKRPYLKQEKEKKIIININMDSINKKSDLKPYLFLNKSSYLGYFIKNYISNNYFYNT